MDSDRSDRQQANSRKLQATHLMRGAALRMESCCAVTIRARAQQRQCPNRPIIGVQSAPPPIRHRVCHNIGINQ